MENNNDNNESWKVRRPKKLQLTEEEWKEKLTDWEYKVLRQKETDEQHTGDLTDFEAVDGHFICRGCDSPIFSAAAKFHSGCGWPAFERCYQGAVFTEKDGTIEGRPRTEILCSRCECLLGHVFVGENYTETNERHCVNSTSLKYKKGNPSGGLIEYVWSQQQQPSQSLEGSDCEDSDVH